MEHTFQENWLLSWAYKENQSCEKATSTKVKLSFLQTKHRKLNEFLVQWKKKTCGQLSVNADWGEAFDFMTKENEKCGSELM